MNPRQPVIISCSEDGLLIDCLFTYNRRAYRPPREDLSGQAFFQLIEEGIRHYWSGDYKMDALLRRSLEAFCEKAKTPNPFSQAACLRVRVRINRIGQKPLSPALLSISRFIRRQRRPARIYVLPSLFLPSHAASPLHRRLWGVFKTGQIESIGLNWSPSHPGYITLAAQTPLRRLKRVAAHEAGHLFGLGDAYAAWYRFFWEAPGTEGYMMRDTTRVQPAELAMLLAAHTTGRMQYFPRSFRLRKIGQGLYRSLIRPLAGSRKKV